MGNCDSAWVPAELCIPKHLDARTCMLSGLRMQAMLSEKCLAFVLAGRLKSLTCKLLLEVAPGIRCISFHTC